MFNSNVQFKIADQVTVRNSALVPIRNYDKPSEIFSFYGLEDGEEHVVFALGDWKNVEVPLVRLHSECLTGDVFHSRKCDCGEQLNQGIEEIYQHGGFIVYLRQEGRGIGLYNKIDAYNLQAQGMDTFAANNHLGFANDLRNFKVAADMLKALGHNKIILLSNNPEKKAHLEANGVQVVKEQETGVFHNEHNIPYLSAKVTTTHHKIALPR
ncbi:GTP cyclohydrolase II [Idiomarina loihiensis]|uniref:GTP cyclohydrolase II RibA n=1 Tax=Idiomarina TaxID=135575 RepID=UPI000D709CBD|nr:MULTISPECIES: GTP cyclohydrolase II RibA [Idiomarina]PWW40328.1 GTP cyclohydrolase II [Idiomarina loihiensis]TDP50019.1 GTP cyclohydrolase II [Idiomarina loihiensis]TDS24629.1 GTP cyclohydrolase II [Idiomarina sp. H2]